MADNVMEIAHSVTLENQKRASLTGISAVESFNEKEVQIKTGEISLTIFGENLNVSKFNTENGTLVVDGKINEIKYHDNVKASGVFKKLFK